MPIDDPTLTLGPVQFNWPVEVWEDFYARIADEGDIDRVVVGELVCSKRLPFYADRIMPVVERLTRAGKSVALCSLALVTTERERRLCADLVSAGGIEIEVNDLTLLAALPAGQGFSVGPLVNVYSEPTLAFLGRRGARQVCLPPELPFDSIEILAGAAKAHRIAIEVWSFGRVPLAISGRCYHARIHALSKDSCQFVCEKDPDGLLVETLDHHGFFAVNGVQVLSHSCATTLRETDRLLAAGVRSFRLSPHDCDMVAVSRLYRDRLRGAIDADEAILRLGELQSFAPLSNGFMFGAAGAEFIDRDL